MAEDLTYRAGTHPEILRRMLAELSGSRPLAGLTTRAPDDPAIALLDAWAVIGDVLTFYQERIAGEGFLRTATERRSILELARLIGYELNPGVSATAFLTFLVDAPTVLVPGGTRVQSVPGQGELPQTFETSADLAARAEWNQLRPRALGPQALAISGGELYLVGGGDSALDVTQTFPLDLDLALPATGTVAAAKVGTVYAAGTATHLRPGDVLLLAGRRAGGSVTQTLVRTVRRIEAEVALDRTRIELDSDAPPPRFRPAAFTAPTVQIAKQAQTSANVDDLVVGQTWSEGALSAWLSVQGWDPAGTLGYIARAHSHPAPKPAGPADPGLFALRASVGFFGHNAPAFRSLTETARTPFDDWDAGLSIWQNSLKTETTYADADCFLERSVPGLTADGWAVFEEPTKRFTAFRVLGAPESSLVGYSLSAKATGLLLGRAADGARITDKPETVKVRRTTAHVGSERLTLARLPVDATLGRGTAEERRLTLDRMVLDLTEGRPIAVTGERADLPGATVSEIVTLAGAEHAGGLTTLLLAAPGLTHRYLRPTVTLAANVVAATHGESVREVVGSGDGRLPNQRFAPRRPPLTHTPSAAPSGADSSLVVRVDGVAWRETPRLYGAGRADEVYLVRQADDGSVAIIFGDGEQGARLPTGVENVVAAYRSGIGRAGMVPAGSLTLLMTRPLGVREVSNPLPASGAADPEPREEARRNAPLTVLTMERVVSLRDAEDFCRAFAGVGKCGATALTRRGSPWIHLTVAASAPKPGGALADHRTGPDSPLRVNLAAALSAVAEPSLRLRLDTYQPLYFNLSARLLADPRRVHAEVEAAVRAALTAAFSFERRSFGQPVTTTEVITTIQRTPGVIFVDLDALHHFDRPPSLPPGDLLAAETVAWAQEEAEPSGLAQLLLVNPLGITLAPIPQESLT
ncbi:hypothetical protein GCM10009555_058310 [Acrocarpospora macrocephala]|uniref:Baseplate assembly protein n=1 Tax=Acrocarpospora macrocephala TaxID=150177 RepID=A0A5M3WST0_9ACTN|nr:putative baseplate assembly protein [Acrocarpospora macrocephala]GES11944.1 hypothetical protein Amac_055410 [Acrocarpospora macrocephala]